MAQYGLQRTIVFSFSKYIHPHYCGRVLTLSVCFSLLKHEFRNCHQVPSVTLWLSKLCSFRPWFVFLSQEVKNSLTQRGVATSKTTPYQPTGNGLVERYNGIIWKVVRLALKSANQPDSQWEQVLPGAPHSALD